MEVLNRLDSGEHVARLHLLAEFFATMTGRGMVLPDGNGNLRRVIFSQLEYAVWRKSCSPKVQFVELDQAEVLAALEKAQAVGVQRARVYDYWHALVAEKAQADELITRNTRHFEGLSKCVAWP